MTCFSLHNREYEGIIGADFLLNGERAEYRSGYGYCFEDIPEPPYHIHIHHREYLDAEYHSSRLPGTIFLLREGEDYFYQQGIRRPVVRRRDALLVIAASRDAAGGIMDPAEAGVRLKKLLAEHDLVIIDDDYGFLQRMEDASVWPANPRLRYYYLVGRADRGEFDDDSSALKLLRSDSAVEAAGPVLSTGRGGELSGAYGASIQAVWASGTTEQEALQHLSNAGYADVWTSYSGNMRFYRVRLPAETGMSMNAHVERIAAIDGVVESEPEIILYQ